MSETVCQRRPSRKKRRHFYRLSRYYKELHFYQSDYWGEGDEIPIINMVESTVFFEINTFDTNGEPEPPVNRLGSTLELIRILKKIKKNGYRESPRFEDCL